MRVLLLLLCSSVMAEDVKPEFDITYAEVTVVWYDSYKELNEAVQYWRNIRGASYCSWDKEGNYVGCVIHAVRPKEVNDTKVTTLGHELLHAFYGNYHD